MSYISEIAFNCDLTESASCYALIKTLSTFNEAQEICSSKYDGRIAVIKNTAELSAFNIYLDGKSLIHYNYHKRKYPSRKKICFLCDVTMNYRVKSASCVMSQ